ncbi:OmpA family protein [Stenotrophomonas rhizophila]|uniref:OmpA family protein n=1 Tax=Stenotrophomonas rhizophila TaxID=216778 RepID=UPI001E4411ED|nr:OmpA family protein [Stenotrophomonas rhizophila]MCC7633897.1 OmpA family protein [Stenotrophomonas rhizophila]MCC7663231.1 OmpA family protein [Stenotrophomonas rhizophila]
MYASIHTDHTPLLRSLSLGLAVLLISACASGGKHKDNAPAGAGEGTDTTAVHFPDPARATLKEGLFVNVDNLRLFARGMSKRQLYTVLGTPHFSEGMWGVREWNYLFNFRSSPGGDYFTCQFQVQFDGKGIAQAGYWKPQACAAVLQPPAPAAVPSPPAPMPSEPLRLSADALFAFDSATLTEDGRRSVAGLLQQVRAASQVQTIQVRGYTDRIGSDDYNLALSQRRAQAVRDALVRGGVPPTAIMAEGRGKADPLVQCEQAGRQALIACLAPNRRVEIAGVAQPR